MSRAADAPGEFVGVNWASSRLQAYRIAADGTAIDEFASTAGVSALDRAGMAEAMDALAARWPGHGPVYACGMIGAAMGWTEVAYAPAPAPAAAGALRDAGASARIGSVEVRIAPGVACRRAFDDAPDVMRGEEVALIGLLAARPGLDGVVALPGAHTKWARVAGGEVVEFFTSMSGEMFARLTAAGLLASVVEGEAADGAAFRRGVAAGRARRLSLGTLLFGARALVVRGELGRTDAASYLRGLLIGSEIADACAIHPDMAASMVDLIGDEPLCRLYAAALASAGVASRRVDPRTATLHGFLALHAAGAPLRHTVPSGHPDPLGVRPDRSGSSMNGEQA